MGRGKLIQNIIIAVISGLLVSCGQTSGSSSPGPARPHSEDPQPTSVPKPTSNVRVSSARSIVRRTIAVQLNTTNCSQDVSEYIYESWILRCRIDFNKELGIAVFPKGATIYPQEYRSACGAYTKNVYLVGETCVQIGDKPADLYRDSSPYEIVLTSRIKDVLIPFVVGGRTAVEFVYQGEDIFEGIESGR